MRIPGGTALAACTLVLATTLLVGCSSESPTVHASKTAEPTPTPVFTSDAEALAAATAVYKKFEAAVDAIGHDGGEDPERIKPYVTSEGYKFELAEAKKYKAEHSHGIGTTALNNAVLQSHTENAGVATVTIYVCEDISDVDRIGPDGNSLVSPDRSNYNDYLVKLRSDEAGNLVISSNEYWPGGGICKF